MLVEWLLVSVGFTVVRASYGTHAVGTQYSGGGSRWQPANQSRAGRSGQGGGRAQSSHAGLTG